MSQIPGSTALDDTYGDSPLTGGNNDLDKDAFMKLLITQFQYQDPLNPMDDKEFIAQLAQFSALEQSMAIGKKMDQVVVSTDMQTVMSITNYIGKEVSARGLELSKKEGVISKIQYAGAEEMSDVYVNIIDKSGQVVSTVQLGARSTSLHEFVWDGKTNSGAEALDGTYKAAFAAKSETGEAVFIDTSITGRVTGTSFYKNVHWLRVEGGRNVDVRDVRETMEVTPPKPKVPGITVTGTRDDDYLVGGEGEDTILGRAGNDIIVYDPTDVLVDGEDGYDFLIAEGDVEENAKNFEAIIRGTSAKDIEDIRDLEDLGLSFLPDGSEIDVTTAPWLANWTDKGKGQWTYSGTDTDIKMTISILSQADDPDPLDPPATRSAARTFENSAPTSAAAAPAAAQSKPISFSEALQNGMKKTADNTIDNTAKSLSNNASNTINKFMKAING